MRSLTALCLTILLSSPLFAQKRKDNIFFCSYVNSVNQEKMCDFFKGSTALPSENAENAVNKILSPLGLPHNFVLVSCKQIQNAIAITPSNGIRYIVYDEEFMRGIDQATTKWSSASILAHEIGHHLCGHTLGGHTDLPTSRKNELEADEFSGFILFKMGATLKEAQAAIFETTNDQDDTFSTHPRKSKRIEAIEKGYNKANAQQLTIKINTSPSAEAFVTQGLKALENKSYQQALRDFSAAINLNPSYASAYLNRGAVKDIQGDQTGALNDYKKAIQIDPNDALPYFNMGLIFAIKGNENLKDKKISQDNFSMALTSFNKSIELDQTFHPAFLSRGILKVNAWSDHKGAIADYTISLQLDSEYDQAYHRRGTSKASLKEIEGAMEDFNKAIEINPWNSDYFRSRALLKLYDFHDNLGAIKDYDKVIELDNGDYMTFYQRGVAKANMQDLEGGIKDLNESITMNNEFPLSHLFRGLMLMDKGYKNDGCKSLQKAASLNFAPAIAKYKELCN